MLVLAFLSQAAAADRPRAGQATESPSPGRQSGAQADASDSNSDSTNDEESEEKSRSKLAEGILSELRRVDDSGLAALRNLVARGAELVDVPPYIALLLERP